MGRWPTVGQAPVASTGFCITSAIRAASANTSRTFDDSLSRDCWCALEINNAENVEKLIEFSFLIVTPSPVRRCDIAINTFASVRGIPPGNLGNAALRRGVCAHLRERPAAAAFFDRSEERRVGKEGVSTGRYGWV